jgi:hypothetical protein
MLVPSTPLLANSVIAASLILAIFVRSSLLERMFNTLNDRSKAHKTEDCLQVLAAAGGLCLTEIASATLNALYTRRNLSADELNRALLGPTVSLSPTSRRVSCDWPWGAYRLQARDRFQTMANSQAGKVGRETNPNPTRGKADISSSTSSDKNHGSTATEPSSRP